MKEPFAIRDTTPFEWHTLLSVQKKSLISSVEQMRLMVYYLRLA